MPKYLLILEDPSALDKDKLTACYKVVYSINPHTWAIHTSDSTRQISEALFSPPSETYLPPSHSVYRIDAWWGYETRTLWEWMDRKEAWLRD